VQKNLKAGNKADFQWSLKGIIRATM